MHPHLKMYLSNRLRNKHYTNSGNVKHHGHSAVKIVRIGEIQQNLEYPSSKACHVAARTRQADKLNVKNWQITVEQKEVNLAMKKLGKCIETGKALSWKGVGVGLMLGFPKLQYWG